MTPHTIRVRRDLERGTRDFGWLLAKHTFSFGSYQDPAHMGYRALRVINEDQVAAAQGFDPHPHRNMEILTYVVSGRIAHKDSTGGEGEVTPGQMQWMSAGRGVTHSEFNPSKDEALHLLQIWIMPDQAGYAPAYQQMDIPAGQGLVLVASPHGREGGLPIRQDARVYAGKIAAGGRAVLPLGPGRGGWVQVISGELRVQGEVLGAGDAASVEGGSAREVELTAGPATELLAFDLA